MKNRIEHTVIAKACAALFMLAVGIGYAAAARADSIMETDGHSIRMGVEDNSRSGGHRVMNVSPRPPQSAQGMSEEEQRLLMQYMPEIWIPWYPPYYNNHPSRPGHRPPSGHFPPNGAPQWNGGNSPRPPHWSGQRPPGTGHTPAKPYPHYGKPQPNAPHQGYVPPHPRSRGALQPPRP